ncbi:MAG: EAL domain-containing protein [Limnospira sp.]
MDILKRTGLAPQLLKLELTESVLVDNLSIAAEQFKRLQAEQIQIAIDDFGTGYASLSYLQYFSFDILKIDRSFIASIDQNLKNQAIVVSILRLAQQLNFQIIAEGVETAAERDFLVEKKCHCIQGFGFCPPLEVTEFPEFVRRYCRG